MNEKIMLFVIFAIFCVLHTRVAAESKCKHGVSMEADRKGTLQEAMENIGEETCNSAAEVCMSIRADALDVQGPDDPEMQFGGKGGIK